MFHRFVLERQKQEYPQLEVSMEVSTFRVILAFDLPKPTPHDLSIGGTALVLVEAPLGSGLLLGLLLVVPGRRAWLVG